MKVCGRKQGRHIADTLRAHKNYKSKASAGMSERTLYRRLKKHRLG
jgi:transcriptional regulator of acetoin/glycerol metabolism